MGRGHMITKQNGADVLPATEGAFVEGRQIVLRLQMLLDAFIVFEGLRTGRTEKLVSVVGKSVVMPSLHGIRKFFLANLALEGRRREMGFQVNGQLRAAHHRFLANAARGGANSVDVD